MNEHQEMTSGSPFYGFLCSYRSIVNDNFKDASSIFVLQFGIGRSYKQPTMRVIKIASILIAQREKLTATRCSPLQTIIVIKLIKILSKKKKEREIKIFLPHSSFL